MGQFSEDLQWFWDGRQWIGTAQVVIPQLPMTEFERSGRLADAKEARARDRRTGWLWSLALPNWGLGTGVNANTYNAYRTWTLEQLALATTYLLGDGEPMLAGEVSAYELFDSWTRDLGLAVTAAHVLIFRIDSIDGQPRQVDLIARPTDVSMEHRRGVTGFFAPRVEVRVGGIHWPIKGFLGSFRPQPVLDAWRQARSSPVAPSAEGRVQQ